MESACTLADTRVEEVGGCQAHLYVRLRAISAGDTFFGIRGQYEGFD